MTHLLRHGALDANPRRCCHGRMLFTPLLLAALAVEPIDPRELDRARVQRHLAAVEAELRARDASHLPPALQLERRRNLDRLHAYRVAGEFPRNSDYPGERVPYFIDDDGVVCAVGHLVAESGFGAVAQEIHTTENNNRLIAAPTSRASQFIATRPRCWSARSRSRPTSGTLPATCGLPVTASRAPRCGPPRTPPGRPTGTVAFRTSRARPTAMSW